MPERPPYAGPERRRIDAERNRLTLGEKAVLIAKQRFGGVRLAALETEQFTEGDTVRKAVAALFDRVEGKLDQEKVERLKKAFGRSVEPWERAGLFTPEREARGYVHPDFTRDYEPLLTSDILAMMEEGTGLDRGYKTPVWAPMDVPLLHSDPERLSYCKLLQEALLEAYHGTAGGKKPNTLLVGPEKRVFTSEQVDLEEIFYPWDRYAKPGVVHNVQRLHPKNHGGVSEEQLLAGLQQRTGGILRLERDRLTMPADVGKKAMTPFVDWERKLKKVLPQNVTPQDIKQAIAYIMHCLETQGWLPDHLDWNNIENSRIALAPKAYIPDESKAGAVSALGWDGGGRRFSLDRYDADYRDSHGGVRVGVRIKES